MARLLSESELLTAPAWELQELLVSGETTSVEIVTSFLDQMERHNLNGHQLRAILFTAPRDVALARAKQLDDERAHNHLRGPLHGLPIIVKDVYATHADLGMPTTAGSFALLGSRPKRNAVLICRDYTFPGLVVIGKTSLTSPGGSSTWSAVGVSAGFAPLGLGTERDGSLVTPGNRAALFGLTIMVGAASRTRIIGISSTFHSPGAVGRTVRDVALVTDVLLDPDAPNRSPHGLSAFLVNNWKGIRVGFVDTSRWQLPDSLFHSDDEYKQQMKSTFEDAATKIREAGGTVVSPIDLPHASSLKLEDEAAMPIVMRHEFRVLLDDYLQDYLEDSKVRSLKELELPDECPGQDLLINSLEDATPVDKVERARAALKRIAKTGIDRALDEHNIQAIIAPTDSPFSSLASSSGYPIATVPLGRRNTNGRPFGVSILARTNEEGTLIRIMSAWEAMFPKREIPTLFKL
ncbi:amidase signature enzyme [Achaetomium macrosporum]|uniref:Amidase signature enzyme n=1 Tax=Achaetomium macrosporum TaxID=79813 RepID=A0AAN7C2K1_9PEZI|nr:amidase signature enzyme [Achaetomium macrosporum]